MSEKTRQDFYDGITDVLKSDPDIIKPDVGKNGEFKFRRNIFLKDGGIMSADCVLDIYPDIHKAEIRIMPHPEMRKESYTAVTKWFIRQRNISYQKDYGISFEYQNFRGRLTLDGMISLRERPENDIYYLLNHMERALAEDYPAILDIYFGIIPEKIRSDLSKEVDEYKEELAL